MTAFPVSHWSGPQGAFIQNVTPVVITIPSGFTNNTVGVLALHPELCQFIWNGCYSSGSGLNPANNLVRIEVSAMTGISITFKAIRGSSLGTIALVIYGTVIEWTPAAVQSIQYGTGTFSGTSLDVSLSSAVDFDRSVVNHLGLSSTSTTSTDTKSAGCFLKGDGTGVSLAKGGGSSVTEAFCVTQFQPGIIIRKEQVAADFTNSHFNDVYGLDYDYDLDNSFLFFGGLSSADTSIINYWMGGLFNNPSSLIFTRYGSGTTKRVWYGTPAQFLPGVLPPVIQQGYVRIAGSGPVPSPAIGI